MAPISPDGKYLAFADKTGFYLRQVATGETQAVALPKGFDARPASWFPDGTHVVASWVAGPTEPPSLWSVSILGGAPRRLVQEGMSPAVSPDGSQIAFLRGRSTQEMWVMQYDGGSPRRLRTNEGGFLGPPAWSPDGKRIAYGVGRYHGTGQYIDVDIEVMDLQDQTAEAVFSTPGLGSSVAWIAHDRLVYAVGERPPSQDDSNLWELHLDSSLKKVSGPSTRLTSDPGFVSGLSATANGKALAFFKHTIQPDIYVAETSNGRLSHHHSGATHAGRASRFSLCLATRQPGCAVQLRP